MKKKAFYRFGQASLCLGVLVLAACGGGGGSDDSGQDSPPPVNENPNNPPQQPQQPQEPEQPEEPEDLLQRIHSLGIQGASGFVVTGNNGEVASQKPLSTTIPGKHYKNGLGVFENSAQTTDTLSSSGLESNTLYKVTNDGRLEPVPFTDEQGEELERGALKPTTVFEVGVDFVGVTIELWQSHDGEYWMEDQIVLLVNKSTGLAYLADDVLGGAAGQALQDPRLVDAFFRFDAAGNIYLLDSGMEVDGFWGHFPMKIDISNLGQGDLTAAPLQTIHRVDGFEINGDGELMAYLGRNANEDYVYGVYNGSIANLNTLENIPAGKEPQNLFLGLDGELYVTYQADDLSSHELYRLNNDGGVMSATFLGALKNERTAESEEDYGYDWLTGMYQAGWSQNYRRTVVNGMLVYIMDGYGWGGSVIHTVDIPNRVVVNHDAVVALFDYNKSSKVYETERYLWISGTSKADSTALVVRYNPLTRETITLDFEQNFELYKMEPVASDRIMFEGRRLADQSRIIGQMNIDGEILEQTVYAASEVPVTVLHAISPADFIRVDGDPQDWNTSLRILSGTSNGPAGHDLVHYSEVRNRGEYLGLVEFQGEIVSGSDHFTRINFDTTSIVSGWGSLEVVQGEERTNALDHNASISQGRVIEFALPEALLGEGAPPSVVSVERFELVRYGAVAEFSGELHEDAEAGNSYSVELTLGSPVGLQVLEVVLTEGYRIEISSNSVTLIDGNGTATVVADVVYPAQDAAGESLTITVPAELFADAAVIDVVEVSNAQGVLVEEQLDILQ